MLDGKRTYAQEQVYWDLEQVVFILFALYGQLKSTENLCLVPQLLLDPHSSQGRWTNTQLPGTPCQRGTVGFIESQRQLFRQV